MIYGYFNILKLSIDMLKIFAQKTNDASRFIVIIYDKKV